MKANKQPTVVRNIPINFFFLVAFTEGASVMAIELTGAKMVAPFYGGSLFVWAAVLTVTLGGLTSGYFLGGRAAYRYRGTNLLFGVLLTGTLLIAVMPFLSLQVMPAFNGLGLRMGALFSTACFMLLPLICMGMVSPIIIQLATRELKSAGKTAGTVYAVSTVGGIIMTMLMGFYLLPEWGIKASILLTSLLLAFPLVLYFVLYRKLLMLGGSTLLLVLLSLLLTSSDLDPSYLKHLPGSPAILYQTEGILGQLTVFEYTMQNNPRTRTLLINGIQQTNDFIDYIPVSLWEYPHRLATLASIKPVHSRALLVGMGGGNLAMELKKEGFLVDIVDIDERMPFLAEKYFGFKPDGMNIIIDDGRHYFMTTDKKYDLVIMDAVNGEVQPYQLFTKEAFAKLKTKIAPDALILINYQGYFTGPHGISARSICKTMKAEGMNVNYFTKGTDEESSDVLLIASPAHLDFYHFNPERLNPCCRNLAYTHKDLVTDEKMDLDDAVILTDDKPNLEALNIYWLEEWRKRRIDDYAKYLTGLNIPLFQ